MAIETVPHSRWLEWRVRWLQARRQWFATRRQFLVYRANFEAAPRAWGDEVDAAEAAQCGVGLELLRLHASRGLEVERRHTANQLAMPPPATDHPHVLIVGANREERCEMRESLVMAGWDVELATGPAEATRLALRHRPDVVLVDISPTAPDPSAVVLGLRCEHGEELPIIAMSTQPDADFARDLGIGRFLQKPCTVERLRRSLAEAARATKPRAH